jgi:colanic acid biosynthesis glycosyl transferase WcaI
VRLGVLTSRKVIAFFAAMERFVYRHARAVTVLSEGFRRNLLAKGVPNAKIVVIPNLVDTAALQPGVKDNPLARREGLGDRFVVLFAGNVGLSQGLEHVLESARLLQGVKGLLFLIVGNGAAKPGLEQEAARMELTNVRFLPFQPRADLADLYASADVCLVPLKHGIADESVPSKMLSISAAGRPLIASVDEPSDTAQHVRESGCGLVVPPEDPQALAAAIMALYRDPDRARRMGMLGRAHVETRFTPEVVGAAYHRLLECVANSPKRKG